MKKKILVILFFILPNLESAFAQQIQENEERPNIIFILTDDQRWDALGVTGNPIIRTSNLDKLGTSGILFQNAYVTTSICCVSRASILTEQYEPRHKIHDFNTDFTPEAFFKTYPYLLKGADYNIGFIGKFGIGHHSPETFFDFWIDTEAGGKGQPNYITTDKNGHEIHDTDTIGSAIQVFLDQFGKKVPFCLSVSFKAPHEQDGNPPKNIIQLKYKDYYKDANNPLPVTSNPKYWNKFPDFFRTDTNFARASWKGLFGTPDLYPENLKNYYRLISGVDDVIGEMTIKLKNLGLAKNTIIIMEDNSMLLGEHGMQGKWYGYEESIRVALLIYDPNLPDKVTQYKAPQIALNIDIAPTILSMAGVQVPDGMQGINLMGLAENKIPERKDFFYQRYFLGSPRISRVEGVVTTDFKYMYYVEHDYEELFDVKYDPHETMNLVNDPKHKSKLQELRERYQKLRGIHGVPSKDWADINSSFLGK